MPRIFHFSIAIDGHLYGGHARIDAATPT